MDRNSDEQLLVMQATIDSNRQDYDKKMKKLTADLTSMIKSIMDQIIFLTSSPRQEGFTICPGSYQCGTS